MPSLPKPNFKEEEKPPLFNPCKLQLHPAPPPPYRQLRPIRIRMPKKVVALLHGWGDELECCTRDLAARMIWTNVFGRTSIFGRVAVKCDVNRMIIHFSKSSLLFFYSSFSSNHPGAQSLIPSPNQQRRPLPLLLWDSSAVLPVSRPSLSVSLYRGWHKKLSSYQLWVRVASRGQKLPLEC